MIKKLTYFFLFCLFIICIFILLTPLLVKYLSPSNPSILENRVVKSSIAPTLTIVPIPTIVEDSTQLISATEEITEGDNATFTWKVDGSLKTIHTTSIYYGTTSTPGSLTNKASPDDTSYTAVTKDFYEGDYNIPLHFIANMKYPTSGTYYFRAYALINGKHYWTEEHTLIVKALPKHEIKIITPPTTISHDETITFTWDITGPTSTTGFTAIVAGKESKPGPLDNSVDTTMTPYKVIVGDFTNTTSTIPLRFVGSTKISETGIYYFRAVAFINGKNIWSDEYSLTVQ